MRVDEKIGKAIDCQQAEAKRNYRGFVTVVIGIIIVVLLLVLFGRVGVYTCFCIACYCFSCNNCLKFMLRCCIMNHPRCGDCAFSASFVKECTDVSYVAGEGVGLTLHKESVVVGKI